MGGVIAGGAGAIIIADGGVMAGAGRIMDTGIITRAITTAGIIPIATAGGIATGVTMAGGTIGGATGAGGITAAGAATAARVSKLLLFASLWPCTFERSARNSRVGRLFLVRKAGCARVATQQHFWHGPRDFQRASLPRERNGGRHPGGTCVHEQKKRG